jgi:hypothetical protein
MQAIISPCNASSQGKTYLDLMGSIPGPLPADLPAPSPLNYPLRLQSQQLHLTNLVRQP